MVCGTGLIWGYFSGEHGRCDLAIGWSLWSTAPLCHCVVPFPGGEGELRGISNHSLLLTLNFF